MDTLALINLSTPECARVFTTWRQQIADRFDRGTITTRVINLAPTELDRLNTLLSRTKPGLGNHIICPTHNAQWTAIITSDTRSSAAVMNDFTDAASIHISYKSQRALDAPPTIPWGSRQLFYHHPDHTQRSISVTQDGRKWRMDNTNTPLPEEDPTWYTAGCIRDRFTLDNLKTLLERLKLPVFEPNFFQTPQHLVIDAGHPDVTTE